MILNSTFSCQDFSILLQDVQEESKTDAVPVSNEQIFRFFFFFFLKSIRFRKLEFKWSFHKIIISISLKLLMLLYCSENLQTFTKIPF